MVGVTRDDLNADDLKLVFRRIPVAYDMGTPLDASYLGFPYTFQRGEHNRVSGQVIALRHSSGSWSHGITQTGSPSTL